MNDPMIPPLGVWSEFGYLVRSSPYGTKEKVADTYAMNLPNGVLFRYRQPDNGAPAMAFVPGVEVYAQEENDGRVSRNVRTLGGAR